MSHFSPLESFSDSTFQANETNLIPLIQDWTTKTFQDQNYLDQHVLREVLKYMKAEIGDDMNEIQKFVCEDLILERLFEE